MWCPLLALVAAAIGGALVETAAAQSSQCGSAPVPCDPNAERITRHPGPERVIGYFCRCKQGFRGDGFSCYRELSIPARIDRLRSRREKLMAIRSYVESKDAKCHRVAPYTRATENERGKIECRCKEGTMWDAAAGACADIDECAACTHYCHFKAKCVNGDALNDADGYRCECADGYVGNNHYNERHKCLRKWP